MASGAKDWISRTDILLQTLAELTIRNKYGTPHIVDGTDATPGQEWRQLVNSNGKGFFYGGWIYLDSPNAGPNSSVRFDIDGQVFFSPFAVELNEMNLLPDSPGLVSMPLYDAVNFKYTFCLKGGFTYESNLSVYIFNGGIALTNAVLRYSLLYTRI